MQIDGSHHPWLAGRGPRFLLLLASVKTGPLLEVTPLLRGRFSLADVDVVVADSLDEQRGLCCGFQYIRISNWRLETWPGTPILPKPLVS